MEDFEYTKNLEVIDLMNYMDKKKRLHQKLILTELEKHFDPTSYEFKSIRKVVLDSTNDFSRSILRAIFGDDFEWATQNK